MTDPYKPPVSDVRVGNNIGKGKRKWKFFFWFMLVLETIAILSMFDDPDVQWFDILGELLVYSSILVGIFGFSYAKRIATKTFWALIIPVGIVYDIYSMWTLEWGEFGSSEELYLLIGFTIIVGLPLAFLQYFALYKYAFRSAEIWASK